MSATHVDDLTIARFDEEGNPLLEVLDKFVLSKGSWSTILFLYREKNKSGEWGPNKARIVRYRKLKGLYQAQSKFNISSAKQARAMAQTLLRWFD